MLTSALSSQEDLNKNANRITIQIQICQRRVDFECLSQCAGTLVTNEVFCVTKFKLIQAIGQSSNKPDRSNANKTLFVLSISARG